LRVYNHNKDLLTEGWVVNRLPIKVPPRIEGLSATFFVKGVFHLHPDKDPTPWEKGPGHVSGDVMIDGDKKKGLGYASDFVPYKPQADFSAIGTAYPPENAREYFFATMRVGAYKRQIVVWGERHWEHELSGEHPSHPVMAEKTSLSWDNARGAPTFALNPLGRGIDGKGMPLLEDPANLVKQATDMIAPAVFAPFPTTSPPRMAMRGTYGGDWLETGWPWLPQDFDFSYYNAPDPRQWIPGYLTGEEELEFDHMHPTVPNYRTRLPGLRARCFVNTVTNWKVGLRPEEEIRDFREVPLVLDTLWVDMDKEQLVLVWRGRTPVRSIKLRDVEDLLILSEPLSEPHHDLDYYRGILHQEMIGKAPPPPPPPSPPPESDGPALMKEATQKALKSAEQMQEIRKMAQANEEEAAKQEFPPEVNKALDQVAAKVKEGLASAQSSPPQEPQVTPQQILEKVAASKDLPPEASEALKAAAAEAGKPLEEVPAGLKMAQEATAIAQAGAEKMGKMAEDFAKPKGPIKEEFAKDGAWDLKAIHAKGLATVDLSGCDLSGLDLSKVDCRFTIFRGAKLVGTNLSSADLTGATLAGADLSDANLGSAKLDGADFAKSLTKGTLWAGASLSLAKLGKLHLSGADFSGCSGQQTDFGEANLTGANFREAKLQMPSFAKATLEAADFSKAVLYYPDLRGAKAQGIVMEEASLQYLRGGNKADFTRGRFRRASAPDSNWEKSTLSGADFRDANLPGSRFCEAVMPDTNFDRAILKKSSFEDAVLHRARLTNADMLRCSFERADLTWAALNGSNLYESGFWETIFHGSTWEKANVRMTMLDRY